MARFLLICTLSISIALLLEMMKYLSNFKSTFSKHLKRIYNIRIFYLAAELATMEDDFSNTYCHCILYHDVFIAHAFIIDLIWFLSLGYVFGSNIVNFRWKIIAQARSLLSEYYQNRSNVQSLVAKYSNLRDEI